MRLSTRQIQLRDPFVVPVAEEGQYYLFGSTDTNIWGRGQGFDYYVSQDLRQWDGPYPAFRPESTFWSEENFWAPEVYHYRDRYYLFATFKVKSNGRRGTAVLVADSIRGPYQPHSDGIVTPSDWDCLDGSLYVDPSGVAWMVFSHEWTEIQDGTICLIPLAPDLKRADGKAEVLFRGSDGPWTTAKANTHFPRGEAYVTDGPYIHVSQGGALVMLWSSFREERYALGAAISVSGNVHGPWKHLPDALYEHDGGHGMIFQGLDGRRYLTLHHPNQTPNERPQIFTVAENEHQSSSGLITLVGL